MGLIGYPIHAMCWFSDEIYHYIDEYNLWINVFYAFHFLCFFFITGNIESASQNALSICCNYFCLPIQFHIAKNTAISVFIGSKRSEESIYAFIERFIN